MTKARHLILLALLGVFAPAAPAAAATREADALVAATLSFAGPGPGVGYSVAQLGDVNGDGRSDVAIGAPFVDLPGRSDAGVVTVVFGSAGATGTVRLDALGAGGFQIVGGRFYRAGYDVTAAGDVNGDGRPDILVSAPRHGVAGYKTPASAYVVYGRAGTSTTPVDLTSLRTSQGFEIVGIAASAYTSPGNIAGVGDLDRDGYADLALTEGIYTKRGYDFRGGVAVVYGSRNPRQVNLARPGSHGFHITGAAINGGPTVAGAGDVNGDRRADLVLGAPSVQFAGKRFPDNSAFVIFGRRRRTPVDVRHLGSRGFRVAGLAPGRVHRARVAGAGDLNGDRRADVLIVRNDGGAIGGHPEAVVVFGSASARTVDVHSLGSRGFRIRGQSATGRFSNLGAVASLGDVNGDRVPDLGIGSAVRAPGPATLYDFSAFVVYGKRSTSALSLDDLGAAGYRLTGPSSTTMCGAVGIGQSMAPAGGGQILLGAPLLNGCQGGAMVVPGS